MAPKDVLRLLTSGVAPNASCALTDDQLIGLRWGVIPVVPVVVLGGSNSIVTASYNAVIPLHRSS